MGGVLGLRDTKIHCHIRLEWGGTMPSVRIASRYMHIHKPLQQEGFRRWPVEWQSKFPNFIPIDTFFRMYVGIFRPEYAWKYMPLGINQATLNCNVCLRKILCAWTVDNYWLGKHEFFWSLNTNRKSIYKFLTRSLTTRIVYHGFNLIPTGPQLKLCTRNLAKLSPLSCQ